MALLIRTLNGGANNSFASDLRAGNIIALRRGARRRRYADTVQYPIYRGQHALFEFIPRCKGAVRRTYRVNFATVKRVVNNITLIQLQRTVNVGSLRSNARPSVYC